MMLPSSWEKSLNLLLKQQKANQRIAILGIGNTFRSDDAAGILIARALIKSRFMPDSKTVLVIDAGHAPENITGELRRFAPDIVLLIDAADMGEQPGDLRWIEMDEIEGMSASTHALPLSTLASYLNWELKCEVLLLGIQPATLEVGETISAEVLRAVHMVVQAVHEAFDEDMVMVN